MRGKVVDINDSIVVLSTSMIHHNKNGVEQGLSFQEEKILTARGHQLKILVEPGRVMTSGDPSGKVVVSGRKFLTKIQASLSSGSISKRKLCISDDQEKLQESLSISKRLHRTSSVPFDFDKLADDMLREFSNLIGENLGPECRLEIDGGAMEQILAAAWDSEEKRPVQTWLEQVFARSLDELKLKCKHASSSTLRLVACEDTVPVKGDGSGALLPPRIILDF
ncbi:hypothetical protein GUJ93_ZPchr0011g27756 [Zizania palustris]|uniref:SMAX1-like AAA+ ATPase lid domain-containing protein n=1 Tax=Zizania palustris TaxID=103762 RepID=A0A8J5WJ89_ZIZPA|nr:hypothetical protein GUJ93_ZPchr0011g27756 [Zizania palustris]